MSEQHGQSPWRQMSWLSRIAFVIAVAYSLAALALSAISAGRAFIG